MNKVRRTKLAQIYDKLVYIQEALDEVNADEQEAFSNIPENMQGSERYEQAEEAANNLEEACSHLADLLELLEELTG